MLGLMTPLPIVLGGLCHLIGLAWLHEGDRKMAAHSVQWLLMSKHWPLHPEQNRGTEAFKNGTGAFMDYFACHFLLLLLLHFECSLCIQPACMPLPMLHECID